MSISVGDRLPEATLFKVTSHGPERVEAPGYFTGRRVALFAVPGAFTPTCSARHLPGFLERADALRAAGVDEIACTAVNDAFVLGAWARANDAGAVTMLADGNADFARALGLEMDGTAHGLGIRSLRYSMLVDDAVVRVLNVERPGAFEVSSAEGLLAAL